MLAHVLSYFKSAVQVLNKNSLVSCNNCGAVSKVKDERELWAGSAQLELEKENGEKIVVHVPYSLLASLEVEWSEMVTFLLTNNFKFTVQGMILQEISIADS